MAGHMESPRGPHAARRPRIGQHWCKHSMTEHHLEHLAPIRVADFIQEPYQQKTNFLKNACNILNKKQSCGFDSHTTSSNLQSHIAQTTHNIYNNNNNNNLTWKAPVCAKKDFSGAGGQK